MVTHDAYSASYAKRVLFLKDGRVFNELLRGDLGTAGIFTTKFWMFFAALGVMSVTLSELSLRNARRQTGTIWFTFVTVVMAAALLYSFNGAGILSRDRHPVQEYINASPVIVLASAVGGVCLWLAGGLRHQIHAPAPGPGTWNLSAHWLQNGRCPGCFFWKNLAVGGLLPRCGTVLGGLLYQAFRAIVLTLFGLPRLLVRLFPPRLWG